MSPAKKRKLGFGFNAAMSAKSRLSCCTLAVLTTPSVSGAARRLQPITTNEYATAFGSSLGEVVLSEQARKMPPAAMPAATTKADVDTRMVDGEMGAWTRERRESPRPSSRIGLSRVTYASQTTSPA